MKPRFSKLDGGQLRAALSPRAAALLGNISVLPSVDSTNRHLQSLPLAEQHAHAVIADQQTAGRGRRGRHWHSPAGGNLYLSLGWAFERPVTFLATLPLAVAVATARGLQHCGVADHGIKWPNDILADGRKLAGILMELRSTNAGITHAVVGVGVNIYLPDDPETAGQIDQGWTDVVSRLKGAAGDGLRLAVAAAVVEELLAALDVFSQQGFEPFRTDWQRWDVLRQRQVEVFAGGQRLHGTALGISPTGGLRVSCENDDGTITEREFVAADVSVRGVPGRNRER